MKTESKESYTTALKYFKNLFHKDHLPRVLVTDRELALIAAIRIHFETAEILLCIWHIEKNVIKTCKPRFSGKPKEEWDTFMKDWRSVGVLLVSYDRVLY